MNTLGWSLTGAAIYVFVALTAPLVIVAVAGKAPTEEDGHLLVGLSWLWPVLGPFIIVGFTIALPIMGLIKYSEWLTEQPKGSEDTKPVEGTVLPDPVKVVE